MSANEAKKLLNKYLNGHCTQEEKQKVEVWLDNINEGNEQWDQFSEEERQAYIKQMYSDLEEEVRRKMSPSNNKQQSSKKWYWTAAAVLFLAATFGTLYMTVFKGEQSPQVISVQDYATTITGIGEMKEVTLKDGTKVWLNAMSELRYPAAFNGNTREVYIKGEAFFEAAQNEQKPFIVHSGRLETKVLGTSFNVKAYPNNKTMDIAVLSGKVAVRDSGSLNKAVVLEKNEQVNYTKNTTVLIESKIDHRAHYLAWREGKMTFYHTPMKEVAKVLHRNYGVDIQFASETIQKYELSGQFDKKEAIESVLKAVCLSIGAKYKKKGIAIVIK